MAMRLPGAVLASCLVALLSILAAASSGGTTGGATDQAAVTAVPDLDRAEEILASTTRPVVVGNEKCDRACQFCLCRWNITHYNGTRCSCDVEPFRSSRLCRRCDCWFWSPRDMYDLSPVEVLWLVLSVLTPFIGSIPGLLVMKRNLRGWYHQLEQPGWALPSWVHLPLGFLLYASAGYASWLVYQSAGGAMAMCLYVGQLTLNWCWPIIFFHYHNVKLACFELLFTWVVTLLCAIEFYLFHRMAGVLMLPYCVWLTFGAILNINLWRLNGDVPTFSSSGQPMSVLRRRDTSDDMEGGKGNDAQTAGTGKTLVITDPRRVWELIKMKVLFPLMAGGQKKRGSVVVVEAVVPEAGEVKSEDANGQEKQDGEKVKEKPVDNNQIV